MYSSGKALVVDPDLDTRGLLSALRSAYEAQGMLVVGINVSNLPSCLARWQGGVDLPTRNTVLVVEGAEMVSLKSLERLLSFADKGRGKVVLLARDIRPGSWTSAYLNFAIHSSTCRSSEVSGIPPFSSTTA